MKRDYILFAILVLIVAGIGYWFYTHFELRKTREYVGYQGKARTNVLLAAEEFLKRTDTPVKSVASLLALEHLPPPTDTLILPTPRRTVDAEHSAQLLRWVRRGGQLVVVTWTLANTPKLPAKGKPDTHGKAGPKGATPTAPNRSTLPLELLRTQRKDTLLAPLGVRQYFNNGRIDFKHYVPAKVRLGKGNPTLQVSFRPRYRLVDGSGTAVTSVSDEYGIHMLHYKLGRGGLTVLSDYDFMQNSHIGDYDNAAFLWQIAHWNGRQGPVWLVHNDDMPSLLSLLVANAWPILIALAVLLVAWLWAASRRFGPLLADPEPVRRSLREHIRASGRFLWQAGHDGQLLQDARRAVLERIDTLHPGWSQLLKPTLHARLSELSGIPIPDIATALSKNSEHNEHEFTRRIRILETLRKAL